MSRWFRFYADALRNPKVLRLSDKDFRLWVRLLAVASENDGHIAPIDDLRMVLGVRLDHLKGGLNRLISGGLIDLLEDGYEPHGWSKYQYKSDSSTERVHRHRAKRNVSETPPDTEADTEVPLPNGNGATDPEKVMFDTGVRLLVAAGKSQAQARSLIGKWKRDQGAPEVIAGIGEAVRLGITEPVAWLEARWKARTGPFEYVGGPC